MGTCLTCAPLFIATMITSLFLASALTLSGVIQTDNGKGVKGIPVSNGDTIVMTDGKGHYSLPVIEDMSIFPVLDGNWEMHSQSKVGNSAFPFYGQDTSCPSKVDFVIKHRQLNKNFTVNAIGDVQVGDIQELDYVSRTLWPELMADSLAAFNLWLGDIVNNNISLFSRMRSMMEMLPVTSWTMVGNHDRDVDSIRTRQVTSFGRDFGAPTYAFTEGNVTFIVLNNVYGDGTRSYKGKLDERQLRFVANLMKILPKDRRIVLTAHIPFAYMSNKEDLLNILKGRGEILALTGHMHAVSRNFIHGEGVTIHELVGGATCGFWWVGEKDWEGIPSALMQCGTPKGYFRVNFTPKDYTFTYKPTSLDDNRQASIWISGIDPIQSDIPDLKDLEKGDILITVYGGCDSTKVEAVVDNTLKLSATKEKLMDPNVARIRELNKLKVYPTKYSRRNPFRHTASPQVWRLHLPVTHHDGTHRIDITATDSYGLRCRCSRAFSYPD